LFQRSTTNPAALNTSINADQSRVIEKSLSGNLTEAYTLAEEGEYQDAFEILQSLLTGKIETINLIQIVFYLVEILETLEEDKEYQDSQIIQIMLKDKYVDSYIKITEILFRVFLKEIGDEVPTDE
jgi:hypothetical protein